MVQYFFQNPKFKIMKNQSPKEIIALQEQEILKLKRELEIEAALERVRAASMAMHKTSQLGNVTMALFEELKILDIEAIVAWISLILVDKQISEVWVFGFNQQLPNIFNFEIGHNSSPQVQANLDAWLKGEEFIRNSFGGEEVIAWLDTLITSTGVNSFNEFKSLAFIQNYESCNKYGTLGMASSQAYTENQERILKRFSTVFEQVYTRFLDLQKAEAQAREAQKEAALERVRAASMAMHSSSDLPKVAAVLKLEIEQFLNKFDGVTIVENKRDKGLIMWASTSVKSYSERLYMPKFQHKFFYDLAEAEKKSAPYFIGQFNKEESKQWFNKLISHNVGWIPETRVKLLKNVAQSSYLCFFTKNGGVFLGNYSGRTYDAEAISVANRFGLVFQQAYTRFLDLQKAENQARELEVVFQENERLLHNILPRTIAEQLKKNQATIVKRFEQVSIMFADIVGFTILSERLAPQKVVDILNGLFSQFDDLTDKYQLEKIKTIGDAYMVASGVPEEKENHALVLFHFAQEMLNVLQTFNQVHNLKLAIRIGISSGPVVAGVIGKKKFAYDLWGDTVNTAARMEAYGQASCIQLSPPSYELLKNEFIFEKTPNVDIKGKGKMDVYVWSAKKEILN